MSRIKVFLAFVILLVSSTQSNAESVQEKGRALAEQVDRQDIGYQDAVARITMTLTTRSGKSTVRKLELKMIEAKNNGDKSLITFDFPADIRGTALLTHPNFDGDDNQWLYLPYINRTKRISSRNKSGAFVGSEFSFEDLSDKSVDDFSYEYLGEQECELSLFDQETQLNKTVTSECEKFISFPKDKYSGYSKQILLVDRKEFRILRTDYYDNKDELFKQMHAKNFKLYDEKYWRPDIIRMVNLKTGNETSLEYEYLSFGNQLTAEEFNRGSLER